MKLFYMVQPRLALAAKIALQADQDFFPIESGPLLTFQQFQRGGGAIKSITRTEPCILRDL